MTKLLSRRTIVVAWCSCVLAAVLLFMIYLPKCAGKMLERDQYREWLEPEEEEFSGVINVWHVVGFKPYMGSVGAWLKKIADRAERRHFGVYFEVESISESGRSQTSMT